MCLGVPGKVVHIEADPSGMTMGRVSFGGIVKDVCLAYVPDVQIGEYVVVHVGFAISKVDEAEARQVFKYLEKMSELAELDIPQPDVFTAESTESAERTVFCPDSPHTLRSRR